MGQLIEVQVREGSRPEVRIFDLDRSLTGMGIERYPAPDAATGSRPPDVLARRLFALGATSATVYSSAVVVEAPAERWPEIQDGIAHAIAHLFEYYGDEAGWSPAALEAAAS